MAGQISKIGPLLAWVQRPLQRLKPHPIFPSKVFPTNRSSVILPLLHGPPWLLFVSQLKQTRFWPVGHFFSRQAPHGGLPSKATYTFSFINLPSYNTQPTRTVRFTLHFTDFLKGGFSPLPLDLHGRAC